MRAAERDLDRVKVSVRHIPAVPGYFFGIPVLGLYVY